MSGILRHLFVVPAQGAPPTGGNLYNDQLLAALGELGVAHERVGLEQVLTSAGRTCLWVDSLYLEHVPALRERHPSSVELHLIAHYLPSWVTHGDALGPEQLSPSERAALACVDGVLCPSASMAALLRERLELRCPTWVLSPGVLVHEALAQRPRHEVSALMVANLVPGKGVASFLRVLAGRMSAQDRFRLRIVGREDMDPGYAASVRALVAEHGSLTRVVELWGPRPHHETLLEMKRANVLVSASRMESYGMALAEGRAAGLVVLAHTGGHAREHVDEHSGGTLAQNDAELADALLYLVREPEALATRLVRAERSAPRARTWDEVAREWIVLSAGLSARNDQ